MTADMLDELQSRQDAEGCFPSQIISAGIGTVDRNGYVAALVLRTLRHRLILGRWQGISARALDWLAECESPRLPGAYAFWPEGARPAWAARVPADTDDTAIMLTELFRYGRIDRAQAVRSVCTVLLACRVAEQASLLPPWVAQGSYLTWVASDARAAAGPARSSPPNLVDACVNANIVALLALLDASHLPGYNEAVSTVEQGVVWAGNDRHRLAALTPFYPAPRSLADAVAHAVECGADGLRSTRDRLAAAPESALDGREGSCRSAWGQTTWHAPVLELAAAIADERQS